MLYADVILPLSLADSYTYFVPQNLQGRIGVGCRVIVPFGQKKIYTAIVMQLHDTPPQDYQVKEIYEVLDDYPILLPQQLKFWQWLSNYYICKLGDVYRAALPSGLKLESETKVVLNAEFESECAFSPREQRIWDSLTQNQEQTIFQLQKSVGVKNVMPAIHSLLAKQALFLKEEVRRAYKPRIEIRVRLVQEDSLLHREDWETVINEKIESLARAKKQHEILMMYLKLAKFDSYEETAMVLPVSRQELIRHSGASFTALKGLLDKEILELYTYEVGRLHSSQSGEIQLKELSPMQNQAFVRILNAFSQKDICLLHGVTSSGKTEVYTHLISEVLKAKKQVLYLLPEIALTTQLTERLSQVFGARVGVYHSKYPDSTRVEIWQKQLSDQPYDIILGVRSSVFLPFQRLGLVIIDEEHETSYKQQDPAPRYHARNAALVLAAQLGAKTLLGTATPSLESYYYANQGKYAYVPLTERYQGLELPDIQVVDVRDQQKKKYMNGPFSAPLLSAIRQSLENKEQVILFQNRRGYAPMVECKVCGWVPKCIHCDVSLSYHRGLNMLTCHYCGYTSQLPHHCPACESKEVMTRGYGTERIEDLIHDIFPEAKLARMDLDTTRTRVAYERIISDFQKGETDILIGTQMVTKGLDFENVSVVGILDADTMMNYPDFRSYERAFQMMAQVAGRAGRHGHRGLVILQTRNTQLPIIQQVVDNDYLGMYEEQMEERRSFRYPPFYRMISIYLKHRKEENVEKMAQWMSGQLKTILGEERVLGPDKPVIARLQNLFIRKLIIKIEVTAPIQEVRKSLCALERAICTRDRSLIVYCDVDPQ